MATKNPNPVQVNYAEITRLEKKLADIMDDIPYMTRGTEASDDALRQMREHLAAAVRLGEGVRDVEGPRYARSAAANTV
jgi:hypothetical protein